jgi:hypothetical protein
MRRDLTHAPTAIRVGMRGRRLWLGTPSCLGQIRGAISSCQQKTGRAEPLSRISADAGALCVRTTGTSEYTPIRLKF